MIRTAAVRDSRRVFGRFAVGSRALNGTAQGPGGTSQASRRRDLSLPRGGLLRGGLLRRGGPLRRRLQRRLLQRRLLQRRLLQRRLLRRRLLRRGALLRRRSLFR